MGYTTGFVGCFKISPKLTSDQIAVLSKVWDTRHDDGEYPSYYCQWVTSDNGRFLEWDSGEKFENYVEWLQLLVDRYFKKWGRSLTGAMEYSGDGDGDVGTIAVDRNVIHVLPGKIGGSTRRDCLSHDSVVHEILGKDDT